MNRTTLVMMTVAELIAMIEAEPDRLRAGWSLEKLRSLPRDARVVELDPALPRITIAANLGA